MVNPTIYFFSGTINVKTKYAHIFLPVLYFEIIKKYLVEYQLCFSRFCPRKSSFNDISYLDIAMSYF